MTQNFLPEGRRIHTAANRLACSSPAGLRRAMEQGDILEGMVLLCDAEHNLTVSVGPYTGFIPRDETALGLREGRVREIAVLSRVGKPVCFTITGLEETEGTLRPILSRRQAQARAQDYLTALTPGVVLPVTVTHLEPFGAFVDMGCGLPSMIGIERISISRIRHPAERFYPGQQLYAVVLFQDRELGRLHLSHRELLGTWSENIQRFSQGMTVPGIVRSVMGYGLFVELAPNLSGLAEPREDIQEGDRVSVYIKAILPQQMKCKLVIIDRLPAAPPAPLHYILPPSGRLEFWRYAPEGCEKPGTDTVFPLE